jgi:transcriptional regulator with GAF, ATPase, and Fis domain
MDGVRQRARSDAFRFCADASAPHDRVEAFRRELRSQGCELLRSCPDTTSPTVAFFGEVTDGFRELIGDVSREGHVLAVRTDPSSVKAPDAWSLLEAGASDVMAWDTEPGAALAIAARLERWRSTERLLDSPAVRDNLIGDSEPWRSVLRQIVEAARHSSSAVLLTGETGTGKELMARLIHTLDARADKAELVVVDCTTIVPTLSGSEFFGHEKGSFTGAEAARDGAFGLADRGTLFLDEVGELPLDLQAELLRVIQEGTYKRVGSSRWRSTAFRLVSATNRDLSELVREGRFRSDLFFRIAACQFELPALRDRIEDVLPLADHFVGACLPGHATPHFEEAVQRFLLDRSYPGNVRELCQLIGRLTARHAGPGPITAGDVPPEERPRRHDTSPDPAFQRTAEVALIHGLTAADAKERMRDAMIAMAIAEEAARGRRGHLKRTAERLDLSVRTLQLWQQDRSKDRDPRRVG